MKVANEARREVEGPAEAGERAQIGISTLRSDAVPSSRDTKPFHAVRNEQSHLGPSSAAIGSETGAVHPAAAALVLVRAASTTEIRPGVRREKFSTDFTGSS